MKDFYSVNELAEQLGVTTRSIRNYLHEGKLKGQRSADNGNFLNVIFLNFFTEIKQMKQQKTCSDSC
nr:MerR family transcriptional regulator [Enterococcus faecium]